MKNPHPLNLPQLIQNFLDGVGKSPKTSQTYAYALQQFQKYLEESGMSTSEIESDLLTHSLIHGYPAWVKQQQWADTTISLYIQVVGKFLEFLIKTKYLNFNLFDLLNLQDTFKKAATLKKDNKLHTKLPSDENVKDLMTQVATPPAFTDKTTHKTKIRKILEQKRNLAIIILLKRSGLRLSELINLNTDQIRDHNGGFWITGKGDKSRYIPLHLEAEEAIETYLNLRNDNNPALFISHGKSKSGNRLSGRAVQKMIEAIATKAGLKFKMSPHSLRHHFATTLLYQTGDLALVQKALGHSNPATTTIYAEVDTRKLSKAIKNLL